MSSVYPPFESLPPRKLQLHHRFILLSSGTLTQMGWAFLGLGSFFTSIFGVIAASNSSDNSSFLGVLIAIIFPIVGLLFLRVALKRNYKTIDLITNGIFAQGKVISKKPTNVKINEQTVFEYTVRFKAEDGKEYEVSSKTHLSDRIEYSTEEGVLYIPADPSWGVIFDAIPNRPEFFPDGTVKPPHWSQLFTLIIPTLGFISFIASLFAGFASIRILLTL